MRFRFIGTYTGGRVSINACGVDFQGHEPADVTDLEGIRRLSSHPEFEKVLSPLDHDGDGKPGGSLPKRGRPRKVN